VGHFSSKKWVKIRQKQHIMELNEKIQSLLEVMYELDEKNISLEVVQQNFTSKN